MSSIVKNDVNWTTYHSVTGYIVIFYIFGTVHLSISYQQMICYILKQVIIIFWDSILNKKAGLPIYIDTCHDV